MGRTFFKGIMQAEARIDGRKIRVPVFYEKASSLTAIFPARIRKLRDVLPSTDYHPLPIIPGIGAVAITAFTYKKTSIGPYNEVSISIPISYKRRPVIPGLGLLSQFLRRELHVYIRHLPVTTQIALDGGVIVYNYPKFLAKIGFNEKGGSVLVTLDEKGERILSLSCEKIPAGKKQVIRVVTYPFKDGLPHEAPVLVNARRFGMTVRPSAVRLELGGRHPVAGELREALLSMRPLQYLYVPDFQSVLYGPVRLA